MRVEFESASLSILHPDPESEFRIGWFVQSVDVNAASIRYRCFHFARVLAPQFESKYLTSPAEVQEAITRLDAIVIVKRLDRAVLETVALAKRFDVPVFLDLCDDLVAPRYAKNEQGVNLLHFLGVMPILAGITVPSAEMADRLEAYASKNGFPDLSVHVVPDIAETWEIFRATYKAVTGADLDPDLDQGARAGGQKRVVWFGNYGASHSNFGMFSLRPYFKALKAVHSDIPLELVIVSNSEPVYRALVQDCGFPTRYVPWSPSAIYSELGAADVALLTTGDDEFCSIKSSNRLLQALAMNVPVIAPKNPFAELEDAIFVGRIEDSLRICLGPARGRLVPPRIRDSRRILERYKPDRLAAVWAGLLNTAIHQRRTRRAVKPSGNVLLVAEPGDTLKTFTTLLSAVRGQQGLHCELLVSTDVFEKQPEIGAAVVKSSIIPSFFSGTLKGASNRLLGCSALVVERPSAPTAKLLSDSAKQLGIPVLSSEEAANGALSRFVVQSHIAPIDTNSIRAGPFEERANADGTVDWAFVVHQNARGWILDAICREIGSRQPDSWKISYFPESAPKAKNYFFSHYLLLQNCLKREPAKFRKSNIFVWYTHPRDEDPKRVAELLLAFDEVTKVIFACESNRQIWLERGLPEEKTAVVLGAADPKLFRFHERGAGVVGLSSSFYERKNPDCLLEVINLLPQREFLLLGRKWNQYALFEEMKAMPNFTYRTAPYREYPNIYGSFDVFLSMSSLEGGPIPLVEAMMSNAVPVASRTGFAPDLIQHGRNGFIFDLDASPEKIAALIECAFMLPDNVRVTVESLDWDKFSTSIMNLAHG